MHAKLSEMELRIVARLNEELGKDASRLHRASNVVSHYVLLVLKVFIIKLG